MIGLALVVACARPEPIRDLRVVVPDAVPAATAPQPANNNLDVVRHDGRLFLAWRTSETHFASPDTEMHVVSSADDGATWQAEATFALGTDVREPNLLSFDGRLWLYFAVLGDDPLDFEPQGIRRTERVGPGAWTEPTPAFEGDFIPWRIDVVDGRPQLLGYTGGAGVYDPNGASIAIHWLVSDDGETWRPRVDGRPVVLEGGGSETSGVFLDDGRFVAVVRNEAGDADGFGSKICRAEASALGDWTCAPDPRKYDSPLVLRDGDDVWLLARRNLGGDGRYDLGRDDLSHREQYLAYQLAYWNEKKRCALWRVDPDALTVTWWLDLPSRGDTCFPEALARGDGLLDVWNYSSDVEGKDWTWQEGQLRPTSIYRLTLDLRATVESQGVP